MKNFKYVLLCLILVSCSAKDDSVAVYESVKEKSALSPMASSSESSSKGPASNTNQSQKPFQWSNPKGWIEKPGNSIRIGSFQLPEKEGKAEVSLIILSGKAGGLAPNINRWRGQVGLGNEEPQKILNSFKDIKSKAGVFKYQFIKNTENKKAIMAGILELKSTTLFVKATGSLSSLSAQEKIFLAFLKDIRGN